MKIFLYILSLYIITTAMIPQDDPYEPNNDKQSATPISYGDTIQNAQIPIGSESERDIDFYTFTGNKGDKIHCIFETNALNYTYPQVLFNDSIIAGGREFTTYLPENGTYYMFLESGDDYWNDSGHYSIEFIGETDIQRSLNILNPQGGEFISGEESFSIKWESKNIGNRISISISNDNINWRGICSSENDGTEVLNIKNINDTLKNVRLKLTETDIEGDPISDTSDVFTLIPNQFDPYEPNNTKFDAYSLSYGDSVNSATISYSFIDRPDKDIYSFNGNIHDRVTITFNSNKLNYIYPQLYLGDSLINSGHEFSAYLPQSGIYHIVLEAPEDYWKDNGQYSFHLKGESNLDKSLTLLSPKQGTILKSEEDNTVRWESANISEKIIIEMTSDDINWHRVGFSSTSNIGKFSIGPISDTLKDVKIRISEYDISGSILSDTSESFVIVPSTIDIYEPNESIMQAKEITYGDSISATLSYVLSDNRDYDYFYFRGKQNDTVSITFNTNTLYYTYPFLYYNDSIIDKGRDFSSVLPHDGTYYLKINSLDNNWQDNGYYSLTLKNGLHKVSSKLKPLILKQKLIQLSSDYSLTTFSEKASQFKYSIVQANGRIVYQSSLITVPKGHFNINIPVSDFAKGHYLIKSELNNKTRIFPYIVK